VSTAQLRGLGYSKQAIHTRSTTGRLHREHRGVYAVGHRKLTMRGRWMAAVLACGEGAVLSHGSAAALHDLMPTPSGPIHVTAPTRHSIDGIRCHLARDGLDPRDVTAIGAIPVTSVSRTALDLAETRMRRQRLRSTLEQAQRVGSLDVTALRDLMRRSPGRRGLKRLAEAFRHLHDEAPWIQSPAERDLLELIREAGLPEPRTNVLVCGALVDAFWPEHRLVVEIDGWIFHRDRRAFETDRRRDAELVMHGHRVVRVTAKRISTDAPAVVRDLRRLLAG
jgi:very-short-patch-repair endonuclease